MWLALGGDASLVVGIVTVRVVTQEVTDIGRSMRISSTPSAISRCYASGAQGFSSFTRFPQSG